MEHIKLLTVVSETPVLFPRSAVGGGRGRMNGDIWTCIRHKMSYNGLITWNIHWSFSVPAGSPNSRSLPAVPSRVGSVSAVNYICMYKWVQPKSKLEEAGTWSATATPRRHVLSPNSIPPPPSSRCAFILAKKMFGARFENVVIPVLCFYVLKKSRVWKIATLNCGSWGAKMAKSLSPLWLT